MAKSSKSTSQRKGASKTSKKIQAYAKARAKALAARQATAKPDEAPSGKTPSARKAELIQQLQTGFEKLYPAATPEQVKEYLQRNHTESMSEKRLLELVEDMKALHAFMDIYASYDDLSDMVQDFQTLLENQVVQAKKTIADVIAQKDNLAQKYCKKMLLLHLNITYDDELLKYAGKFTGDTNKHKLNLRRTQLYRDISSISVGDIEQQEEIRQTLDNSLNLISIIFQGMADPVMSEVPEENYPSYLKEVQDYINNFALQSAKAILDLNDKYVKTPMDTNLLANLLQTLDELGVKETSHKLAQHFEDFLSDEIFYGLPIVQEAMLIYPDLLRIAIKHSMPVTTLVRLCNAVFQQSYRWYSLPPKEFIAQMKELKENREKQLEEAH